MRYFHAQQYDILRCTRLSTNMRNYKYFLYSSIVHRVGGGIHTPLFPLALQIRLSFTLIPRLFISTVTHYINSVHTVYILYSRKLGSSSCVMIRVYSKHRRHALRVAECEHLEHAQATWQHHSRLELLLFCSYCKAYSRLVGVISAMTIASSLNYAVQFLNAETSYNHVRHSQVQHRFQSVHVVLITMDLHVQIQEDLV